MAKRAKGLHSEFTSVFIRIPARPLAHLKLAQLVAVHVPPAVHALVDAAAFFDLLIAGFALGD
jgi:hypothetical protein